MKNENNAAQQEAAPALSDVESSDICVDLAQNGHGNMRLDAARAFARMVQSRLAAVAPSDAKADAEEAAKLQTLLMTEFECYRTAQGGLMAWAINALMDNSPHRNRPAPATIAAGQEAANAKDAARWRAFIGSARIRPLGSAGLNKPEPDNYAHMGLEIWTKYSRNYKPELLQELDRDNERGREWLIKYADVAIEAQRAAMAAAPSSEKGGDK